MNARIADQKNAESDRAWWWKPAREAPSLVLEPTQGLDSSGEVRDLNILRQLQMIDSDGGVSTTTWQQAVEDREICGRTVFMERLKVLKDSGRVENRGSGKQARWAITPDGQDYIEDATRG